MINKTNKELKEHYSTCELWLPAQAQWRYFIFKLPNGTFKRFHIKDKEELRFLLTKYTPLIVYYSASTFLNIQNVRGITKTRTYPIKIEEESDFIIDIDNDYSISKAGESALRIIDVLGNPNYILKTRRGYHLCYYKQRKNKEEYLERLKDIKYLDVKCTKNPFSVFTLPLTLNKNGEVCPFVHISELHSPVDKLDGSERELKSSPNEEGESQTRGLKSDFGENLKSTGFRSKHNKAGMGSELTILSFNNHVRNSLYIPILIYDKSLRGLQKELRYLIEHYDLGNLYVFENEKYFCFISLKIVDERRLMKILNSSRSPVKNQFKKFKKIWFNLSEFKPLIKVSYDNQKYFRASKKHYNALVNIGFQESSNINEFVGSPELKVYEVGIS